MHLMSEREDPILTSWQYGLGKTVAFNSDGENNWTANYGTWSDYPLFWKNIIEYTITDMSSNENDIQISQTGSSATVTFSTKGYTEQTNIEVIASDEKGNSQKIILNPSKPGIFAGSLDTFETGIYSINVTQKEGEEVVSTENTAIAVQYSSEYRIVEDTKLLEQWVEDTNGSFVEQPVEIFKKEIERVNAKKNLAPYFLTIAIFLFMIDIVCKRLDIRKLELVKKGGQLFDKTSKRYKEQNQNVIEKQRKEKAIENKTNKLNSNFNNKQKEWNVSTEKKEPTKSETEKTKNNKELLDTATLLKKKNQR